MANCDMCGKTTENLYTCQIEGTNLNVCKDCCKYGKVIKKVKKPKQSKKKVHRKKISKEKIIQVINENYPNLIKNKREKLGLKQEELAIKLAERESLIRKIERGEIKPSLKLARKLEDKLGIKLVLQKEVKTEFESSKEKPGSLTIGDKIKLK